MDLYNASNDFTSGEETISLTLEEYEDAKKTLETVIQRADCARRLSKNPDFISLVMEGYLDAEPQRIAGIMASGRLPDSSMENCKLDLRAVGSFRNYLKDFIEQGNLARDELTGLEEARDMAIQAEENQLANAQ